MQYKIEGEPLPVVICELAPQETMICEKGAMSWMTGNMQMETKTGGGGLGKLFGPFRRKHLLKPLYRERRSRPYCLCFQLPGIDPRLQHRAGF